MLQEDCWGSEDYWCYQVQVNKRGGDRQKVPGWGFRIQGLFYLCTSVYVHVQVCIYPCMHALYASICMCVHVHTT